MKRSLIAIIAPVLNLSLPGQAADVKASWQHTQTVNMLAPSLSHYLFDGQAKPACCSRNDNHIEAIETTNSFEYRNQGQESIRHSNLTLITQNQACSPFDWRA